MFGWVAPSYTPAMAVLAVAVAIYVVAIGPVIGRRRYRRLLATPVGSSRGRVMRRLAQVGVWWLVTGLALVPVLTAGVTRVDMGLVWPGRGGAAATVFGVGVAAIFVSQGVLLRRRVARGGELPDRASMAPMLPFTTGERWVAALVALTAGVCEEVVFRGALTATGVGVFGLAPVVAAALSLLAFGLAHAYRGVPGILGALMLGLIFALLYAMTHSLLIAIAVHALIDVNALLIVPSRAPDVAVGPSPERPSAPGPVPA